jgi:hypothetical protein
VRDALPAQGVCVRLTQGCLAPVGPIGARILMLMTALPDTPTRDRPA